MRNVECGGIVEGDPETWGRPMLKSGVESGEESRRAANHSSIKRGYEYIILLRKLMKTAHDGRTQN